MPPACASERRHYFALEGPGPAKRPSKNRTISPQPHRWAQPVGGPDAAPKKHRNFLQARIGINHSIICNPPRSGRQLVCFFAITLRASVLDAANNVRLCFNLRPGCNPITFSVPPQCHKPMTRLTPQTRHPCGPWPVAKEGESQE